MRDTSPPLLHFLTAWAGLYYHAQPDDRRVAQGESATLTR